MSLPSATSNPATLGPGVAEPSGGFARGERQRPSGRGPRAREHRLQARLAQQPTSTSPTVAACARRAFRGTRVVARRNALADSSSTTTPSGPARPLRLARVPRPGMTNTDVRLGTHRGDRNRKALATLGTFLRPLDQEVESRISRIRYDTEGRELTEHRRYAPTSVHVRRNQRSRSPRSVFNFSEIPTVSRGRARSSWTRPLRYADERWPFTSRFLPPRRTRPPSTPVQVSLLMMGSPAACGRS